MGFLPNLDPVNRTAKRGKPAVTTEGTCTERSSAASVTDEPDR